MVFKDHHPNVTGDEKASLKFLDVPKYKQLIDIKIKTKTKQPDLGIQSLTTMEPFAFKTFLHSYTPFMS